MSSWSAIELATGENLVTGDELKGWDYGFGIAGAIAPAIKGGRDTERGFRPDPSTYLPIEYINNHLSKFEYGVTRIQWAAPDRPIGPPKVLLLCLNQLQMK
ncbi:pre-toxin TG domain-containing protein [Cohnella panacarvi]|uniref:pre-toxin TG domain-containing protein n=1 Tax=Cohnella panacarvi TaxID=400776 RepID=UPI00047DE57B